MNTSVIDRYLTARIAENAAWYAHKQALDTPYTPKDAHNHLFYVASFASMLSLAEGHTVLILPKNQPNIWQALLSVVVDYLTAQMKDERFSLDFVEVFAKIDECHAQTSALQALINDSLSQFNQAISRDKSKLGTLDTSVQELNRLCLSVFRVYYLLKIVLQDDVEQLAVFMQHGLFDDYQAQQSTKPLIIKNTPTALYLWSNRAWRAEYMAMGHISRICQAQVEPFEVMLPDSMNREQQQAVRLVSQRPFAIITGGPGTGKTFTVAQIVLALMKQNPNISLALAAPTGKAAQRMSESLQATLIKSMPDVALPEPKTIHRLLGIGRHGSPRYHDKNPMPYDVIIVDEASMLGAELSRHLLAAVKTGARLILLGDEHQLAAVDAGAVLADLCRVEALQDYQVHLVESRRFHADSGVGRLATLINTADDNAQKSAQVLDLIDGSNDLAFMDIAKHSDYYQTLVDGYQVYFEASKSLLYRFDGYDDVQKYKQIQQLIQILNQYRILSASHIGEAGDVKINEYIAKKHREYLKTPPSRSDWYHGRVVMVQMNRYDLGLFNGDVGVCVREHGELVVYFDGDGLKKITAAMLGGDTIATAYAITVHKSQGSEFDKVTVVFDDSHARLLSKELIYTAVTRAKQSVQICTTPSALQLAVSTPTVRTTGLGLL